MNILQKGVQAVKNVFRDQPGKPTLDQRLMSGLHAAQNIPKFDFSSKTINDMRPGFNKTAAQVGLGTAESLANTPANLITGSTIVGEQLGNAMTRNPVQWGRAAQGAGQLGSSLLNGAMVQGAMSPFMPNNQKASAAFRAANPSTSEGYFKNAAGQWYDPLNGRVAKTADVPRSIPQVQTPPPTRMIPINQGDVRLGEFNIGRTPQDFDPNVFRKLIKSGKFMVGK